MASKKRRIIILEYKAICHAVIDSVSREEIFIPKKKRI
jgi:hypothetical protein